MYSLLKLTGEARDWNWNLLHPKQLLCFELWFLPKFRFSSAFIHPANVFFKVSCHSRRLSCWLISSTWSIKASLLCLSCAWLWCGQHKEAPWAFQRQIFCIHFEGSFLFLTIMNVFLWLLIKKQGPSFVFVLSSVLQKKKLCPLYHLAQHERALLFKRHSLGHCRWGQVLKNMLRMQWRS